MNGALFAGAGLVAAASRSRARTRRGAIGLVLALVLGGVVAGGMLAGLDVARSHRAVEAARSEHQALRVRHEILRLQADLLEARLEASVDRERSLSARDQGGR
ncbi:MAG TPA: hypothetical protein VLA75_00640 [Thermoanaerobaculia bacterium]|nr:hypothetical protein [Thermoanaerobaculia bacterium]